MNILDIALWGLGLWLAGSLLYGMWHAAFDPKCDLCGSTRCNHPKCPRCRQRMNPAFHTCSDLTEE